MMIYKDYPLALKKEVIEITVCFTSVLSHAIYIALHLMPVFRVNLRNTNLNLIPDIHDYFFSFFSKACETKIKGLTLFSLSKNPSACRLREGDTHAAPRNPKSTNVSAAIKIDSDQFWGIAA